MFNSSITSKRVWWLVDCDSFFASCEVLKNPKLAWKPVCVWKDIVIAATYEAKAHNIKTGTPMWEAKKILWSKGVYLEPDIAFYGRISNKLIWVLKDFSNDIEVFSIDESFIDITWLNILHHKTYEALAKDLQLQIKKQIWIPVSIWVSNTKLRAKIFSKINKPFWTFVQLTDSQVDETFKKLPIIDIPFIWKKSAEKIKYESYSIYDFKSLQYNTVNKLLKWHGIKIWLELKWVDAMSLGYNKFPK